jgi:hypothetical protein
MMMMNIKFEKYGVQSVGKNHQQIKDGHERNKKIISDDW